jgi:hypothetical protein
MKGQNGKTERTRDYRFDDEDPSVRGTLKRKEL